MNFIRKHLISKIKDQVKEKQNILKYEGFIFFDKEIVSKKLNKNINRVNFWSVYPKEELIPVTWSQLESDLILEVYSQLKENNFYIYKIMNGKSHKMRIKKR